MLIQLHWQYKDGTTNMRAQRDIKDSQEMRKFVDEMWKSQPPPKGAVWMACNEKSEHFVFMKAEDEDPNLC